jgi:hypothetical protein
MVRSTTALPSGRAVVIENRRFMDLCAPPENTERLADRRKPDVGRNLCERFRDLLACDPNVERGVDVGLERSVRANGSVDGAQDQQAGPQVEVVALQKAPRVQRQIEEAVGGFVRRGRDPGESLGLRW